MHGAADKTGTAVRRTAATLPIERGSRDAVGPRRTLGQGGGAMNREPLSQSPRRCPLPRHSPTSRTVHLRGKRGPNRLPAVAESQGRQHHSALRPLAIYPTGSTAHPLSVARSIPPIRQTADESLSTVGSRPAQTPPSQFASTAPTQLGFHIAEPASALALTNPTGPAGPQHRIRARVWSIVKNNASHAHLASAHSAPTPRCGARSPLPSARTSESLGRPLQIARRLQARASRHCS